MTADVAGPLSPGLDPTSKGTMGKNLRYLLVAKYLVPRAFISEYAGRPPPDDHGIPPEMVGTPKEDDNFFGEAIEGKDNLEEYKDFPIADVEVIPGDYEEDVVDYGISDGEPDTEEKEEENLPDEKADMVMKGGDCEPPEMTYLLFGTALPNNQSSTVRRALQDIVLYLQIHGFPIYRFHSDKGEFYNHQFKGWLRDQGVYGTWSEPGVPQSNGHAESSVRWLKDRTRTLLRASGLPVRLWPVAAMMAASEQRAQVLNWKSLLVAPFGAPVHLKKKAFDKAGPLRREQRPREQVASGEVCGAKYYRSSRAPSVH